MHRISAQKIRPHLRRSRRVQTAATILLLATAACASSPESGRPSDPETSNPYAALSRLAQTIDDSRAVAEAADASKVPLGRSEGALHVLRLLRRAIDEEIAWADTEFPYFQAQDERYAKLALGNPDNLYLAARVDENAVYRIRGRRGTTADFAIQVYQGYPGIGRPMAAKGALSKGDLKTGADGRFEVIVGGARRPGNWIPLERGSRRILVRYTYGDWSTEEAGDLTIERIDLPRPPARPPNEAEVAARISSAADYLEDALTGYLQVVGQVYSGLPPNAMRPLRRFSGAEGGLSNQYNATGRYSIGADQALIVTTLPSDARYQGFQIGTEWFEALDFVNQTTSLNSTQARLSSDGVYRFVISQRDPGTANWLDASGAPQGQMLLRWQGVSALGPEHEVKVELVDLDSLRGHFPGDEPFFSAEQRRAQIAERQSSIQRRYGLSRR